MPQQRQSLTGHTDPDGTGYERSGSTTTPKFPTGTIDTDTCWGTARGLCKNPPATRATGHPDVPPRPADHTLVLRSFKPALLPTQLWPKLRARHMGKSAAPDPDRPHQSQDDRQPNRPLDDIEDGKNEHHRESVAAARFFPILPPAPLMPVHAFNRPAVSSALRTLCRQTKKKKGKNANR